MKTEVEFKHQDNKVPFGSLPTNSFCLSAAGSLLVKASKHYAVLVIAKGNGNTGDILEIPSNQLVTFVQKLEVYIE